MVKNKSENKKITLREIAQALDSCGNGVGLDNPHKGDGNFFQHLMGREFRNHFFRVVVPQVEKAFDDNFSLYGYSIEDSADFTRYLYDLKLTPLSDGFHPPEKAPSKAEEALPKMTPAQLRKFVQFIGLSPAFSDQMKKMLFTEYQFSILADSGAPIPQNVIDAVALDSMQWGDAYAEDFAEILRAAKAGYLKGHYSNYRKIIDKYLLKTSARTNSGVWYYKNRVRKLCKWLRSALTDNVNANVANNDAKIPKNKKEMARDIAGFLNDIFKILFDADPKFTAAIVYSWFYSDV